MAPSRQQLARLGAPAALLLGVTLAVLLVRAGLQSGSTPTRTSTLGPVTHASTTAVPRTTGARSTGTFAPAGTSTAPGTSTQAAAPRYYTVRKGDTFGSIAAKEGTTVSQLEALNPGVSSNALQVGQRLRVG